MTACNEVDDYKWLTSDEALAILRELAVDDSPLHTAIGRLRKRLSAKRAHLVIEQVELRRRAVAKFSSADRMFFTRTALEQATDEHIARYKASRFAQRAGSVSARSASLIADLCCGIGGDLLALAGQGSVLAVDSNPIATCFAAANVDAVVPSADVQFQTVDVAEVDLSDIAAWHIDPDRRASGRRTTSLEACYPDCAMIECLLERVPHAAIKLAPATVVPAAWVNRCELQWISRRGECRQLVMWHGTLADAPGMRRATIVSSTEGSDHRTVEGNANHPLRLVREIHDYIFDVDPAVLAARLTGALAAAHQLCGLAAGPTYLTGPASIDDAALQCFKVEDLMPLRVQPVAKYLRERGIGELEIKKRGVDVSPEKLRRDLKLRGDKAAVLILAQVAGRPTAILAQRIP